MDQEQLESIMELILHGGQAKSLAMEAIALAKSNQCDKANEMLKEADKALIAAHHSQTAMLTQEAQGHAVPYSLLLVHGQDHLMTSITFVDLAKEVVAIYERISGEML